MSGSSTDRSEVHLFILWSESRRAEQQILADIAERFPVLDVAEVTWAGIDAFSRGLTALYGTALPPGSDKETTCGSGPFLVVVVEVPEPRYRLRRVGRRFKVVNATVFDARQQYRLWTGGGHRVHASDSRAEADRNLAFLFGRTTAGYRDRRARDGGPARRRAVGPLGTHGWDSVAQLLLVLGPYGNRLVGTDGGLVVRTADLWWAERIAGGRAVADGVREVQVGGEPVLLTLLEEPADRPGRLGVLRRAVRTVLAIG